MQYIHDKYRHLICIPYSIDNLHQMARELGIKRCWFHNKTGLEHYDIPIGMIAAVREKSRFVSWRMIIHTIKEANHARSSV